MTKNTQKQAKQPPNTAPIGPKTTTNNPSSLEKAYETPVEKIQNALTRQKAQKSHTQKHQEKRKSSICACGLTVTPSSTPTQPH
jgi:hypothetical protein